MVKRSLAVLAMVCLFATNALADTIAITGTAASVSDSTRVKRYVYALSTVAAEGTQEFSINVPWFYGRILGWTVEPGASTDADVWVSEVTGAAITDATTRLAREGINLGYSFVLPAPEYYVAVDRTLFVTVKNDDTVNATGTSYLFITFQTGGF